MMSKIINDYVKTQRLTATEGLGIVMWLSSYFVRSGCGDTIIRKVMDDIEDILLIVEGKKII